jgi:hypothetical protein
MAETRSKATSVWKLLRRLDPDSKPSFGRLLRDRDLEMVDITDLFAVFIE